jgi:hypothetical protein
MVVWSGGGALIGLSLILCYRQRNAPITANGALRYR